MRMAECQTMARKKSKDSMFQSQAGGCGHNSRSKSYHHHQPSHYPYQHSQQNQHHHHQQQQQQQQHHHHHHHTFHLQQSGHAHHQQQQPMPVMCSLVPNVLLYSQQSPPSPHNNQSFVPPRPQPSSVSTGVLDCQHVDHFPPLPAPLSSSSSSSPSSQGEGDEPPPRPWIQLAHAKHKRTCFTVLCYNILCPRYASKTLYSYCPTWALDWNYRRKIILQELVHYTPDIISLQEMETDQFYNFFLPQLQMLGYSGIFGAKSRARTMAESKRKLVDGCAIFYRTNKFRLLSEHLIEFSQVAMANAARYGAHNSEEMLNRVQTKDNIALAALLETKLDPKQVGGLRGLVTPRPRPLLVCTCHIHWDPDYCDVKLVQAMMLMQELQKITDKIPPEEPKGGCEAQAIGRRSGSSSSNSSAYSASSRSSTMTPSSSSSTDSNLDKVNLLVCGDFNSLPQSGVVEFMQTGTICSTHPDFKGLSYDTYMKNPDSPSKRPPTPQRAEEDTEFQHDFSLKSVYSPNTMPCTNYTLDFQGVIDYIFHSVKGLRPLGLLGSLDPSWLVQHNILGAPHPFIPSDHFPLLVELEMIPAI